MNAALLIMMIASGDLEDRIAAAVRQEFSCDQFKLDGVLGETARVTIYMVDCDGKAYLASVFASGQINVNEQRPRVR